MSDELIYGENDRDFHSPFDIGFDPAAVETVKWLVLGHLFYVVGLAFTLLISLGYGNVWVTPLFGLPLLWAGRKHREWTKILVFVVLFTAVHYLAVRLAIDNYSTTAPMLAGLIAGAVGGAGSLALCAAFRLFRPGAPTLVFAGFGAVLLAGVGSMGVYIYTTSAAPASSFGAELLRLLWVYTPWQLALAYVLAKSLKPVGS